MGGDKALQTVKFAVNWRISIFATILDHISIWVKINWWVVMSIEMQGVGAPDEQRCRYGASKLTVRGPLRKLDAPYVAFLGGSETYGQHVRMPFSALIEGDTGKNCINLGVINAGLDAFVQDPEVLAIVGRAEQVVIQILGAQNLSNRFYRVHPRRNDRFLKPSALLSAIYRDVDFTEFHFIKHMLETLQRVSPDRFATVQDELQQAWLSRMRLLLRAVGQRVVLLWLQYSESQGELGPEPLAITGAMVDQLRPIVSDVVVVPVVSARLSDEVENMMFSQMQAPAAAHLIGPSAHHQIAEALKAKLCVP